MSRRFGTYLSRLNVHRPTQPGISGTKLEGADSIALSGKYVDDEDYGDYILYTGQGGRDANTGKQTADQSAETPNNAGLITSMVRGLPVRVIRGPHPSSPYAPRSGYVYGGLFAVTEAQRVMRPHGFFVMRFRLERLPEQATLVTRIEPEIDPA